MTSRVNLSSSAVYGRFVYSLDTKLAGQVCGLETSCARGFPRLRGAPAEPVFFPVFFTIILESAKSDNVFPFATVLTHTG